MFDQADDDDHNTQILDSIIDCRKEINAVDKADLRLITRSAQKCLRRTTSS